ncbi:hypothetical protein BXO88_12295 [Oribacterium sp. C9]|uniref:PIN domain-containing protein n=1 Tax=Oribacterium sp. C9 TaxID=1943579 RepID=UPI00098FBEAB|nr:PIN domain-containing protein [Oribacterium sp. C9]OON85434.1 hypothetical protein BXO88_12295 [Oribacterium sp. C9]
MIILVDFENTHVSGLDGYEYLNDSDTLVMYYSDENSAVTRGMVTDLKKRNVHVSLVKLLKQHSNALDMYIASTTGMFLESGEKICIVSKDKGYAAVRDFWHSLRGAEILLGETIKECFLSSEKNDDERISLCKERAQKATLVESFATMNTIPTRPTLSKANQRRRNRNIHFTEVSEPASLIPNPLMFETPADQLVKQMKEMPFGRVPEAHYSEGRFQQNRDADRAEASEDSKRENKKEQSARVSGDSAQTEDSRSQDRTRREDRRRDGSRNQGDRNRNRQRRDFEDPSSGNSRQDISKAENDRSDNLRKDAKIENSRSLKANQENSGKEEKAVSKNSLVKSEPEKTAIIIRPEQKTSLAKSEPKYDPNRVQFVYDPVSRSMKKVGEDTDPAKIRVENTEKAAAGSETTVKNDEAAAKIQKAENTVAEELNDQASAPIIDSDQEIEKASEAAASTGQSVDDTETITSDVTASSEIEAEAVTEVNRSEISETEDAISEDTAPRSDDETATVEKRTARKSGARKSASKRKTARKRVAREASVEETAAETTAQDAETLTSTADSTESDDNAKKTAGKTKRKGAKKADEKADADENQSAEKKPKRQPRTKKTDAESAEVKSKKSRAGRKPKTSENAGSESSDAVEQTKASAVAPQEAVEKYGLTANTLHTYYVRLVKAYGKEEGRAVYDASKKAVQEEIKKRKAAEKAAEKAVSE